MSLSANNGSPWRTGFHFAGTCATDPDKAAALGRWLRQVEAAFGGRVLGIDNAVSDHWGRISAIRPIPVIDGLLAATAMTHGLTLVTRNDRDIAGLGPAVLNPFQIGENRRPSKLRQLSQRLR